MTELVSLVAFVIVLGAVAGMVGELLQVDPTRNAVVGAVVVFVLVAMLGGCAVRAIDTQVRRVDSLGGVDALADELGAHGWRIVELEALGGGAAYVVVLEREVVP